MKRGAPILFLVLAACHHEQVAEPVVAPAGEVWVTPQQAEEARLTTLPVAERELGGAIVTSGRLAFDDLHVAHVFSPVTGRVTSISASLGQRVKKGDPLATIDSPDLGTAGADVAKAEADAIQAEHEYKRQKELYALRVISQRDLETSEDNWRKSRAELDRARAKARLLSASGAVVGQGYVLRALIDGEVVARMVNPGQEVAGQYGGGTAVELFTIGERDPLWAVADVFEMDIARIKSGQAVTVKVVAYPDKVFEGKVDWIAGTLDPATRTQKVRCTLPNPAGELRPEMFATISIGVQATKQLSVPSASVLRLGEQTVVFVRAGDGPEGKLRFERRPVKVSEDTPGAWLPVSEGLKPGEQVVNSSAILLSGVMIQKLIQLALRMRFVVFLGALGLIVGGSFAYRQLDIEAYPNPVPPLVEVITQPPGWSAEEVERYVTIPLEIGLAGMPGLDHVRSQSLFGLSDVKCYFKWGTTYDQARQEVINRLQFVQLPTGMQAQLSPWNAIGEIFRYVVRGKGYSLKDLKTAEDWVLERQFKQVPGVIDVTSYGGETKQYQVSVDPNRLRAQGVTLQQLMAAITAGNQNVGGQRLIIGEQAFNVRGVGLIRDVHDIEDVVISAPRGTPIRVSDVAQVDIGFAPRLGMVGHDDEPDIVQGIVLMRYGGDTQKALQGVYKRIQYIRDNHLLPPGMDIEPYYDRGKLVAVTTHTVIENLLVGMGLVTVVLFLFLGNVRASMITALNIPMALLVAFCGMTITGTPANLISLGAVDFGIVVDSTVIMMENIFRHMGPHGRGTIYDRIVRSSHEVGGPMTFSTVIIGVAFLPLFTMTGVSGVIFSPMAMTYAFAIGGAIFLALTLTPVLSATLMKADMEEEHSWLMRMLEKAYAPLFAALRYPRAAVVLCLVVPLVLGGIGITQIGGEFMPKLEEGNLWIRATLPTSISLDQSASYVGRMRDLLRGCPADKKIPCTEQNRKHPYVETVVSQLGRPDDGTDVSGFYNIELFAPLRPFDEWPHGLTKDKLTADLSAELGDAFPGVNFNFSQMISDNVEEAMSGIKGENSVKVIGPSLIINEDKAQQIVDVMRSVPGVADLGMFHTLGQPNVRIAIDRRACARSGLNTGDVDAVIQAAIGGQAATQVFEGEKSFDLTVRWLPAFRNSIDAIRRITVAAPDGSQIPLGQLATIVKEEGPALIYREDGSRYAPVKFSIRGRDLVSTIADAKRRINDKVKLPYDTHLEWAGQINEYGEAMDRFLIIIPLTFLIIGVLVYSAVKTWLDTVIVLLSIPVACAGGVFALVLTRINFSVSAAMGFISIFGIAIQDAILVVTYYQRLRAEGETIEHAAREAADKRLRPVLMTTLVATLGLLPAALSNGIGAQTQKPLAVVVIGGSLILAVLTRAMQPPLLLLAHRWSEGVDARRAGAAKTS